MLMGWCPSCGGKGYLSVANSVDDPLNLYDEECPECEGSGLERDTDDSSFQRTSYRQKNVVGE